MQLEDLKDVNAGAQQQRIDELQKENTNTKKEYKEKLDKQAFEFSLEKSLSNAGDKNPTSVKALLDTE